MVVYERSRNTRRNYPQTSITNGDLEKMVDTNDEWIVKRSGLSGEPPHPVRPERRVKRRREVDKHRPDFCFTCKTQWHTGQPLQAIRECTKGKREKDYCG